MPSFRKLALGAASRAWIYATPDAMMPSAWPPSMRRVKLEVSFQSLIAASFLRSRRCAGRAKPGNITRPGMSRTKCGVGASMGPRGRTTVREWHTRVVMRNITGRPHCSESCMASIRKS
jgi:hypothetical protein